MSMMELEMVYRFIGKHSGEDLSWERISEFVNLSPDYLRKEFREHYGTTLSRCVRDFRMKEAAKLLTMTSERIGMIADRVGIRNQSYFSKCFREWSGMTPRQFREKYYSIDDGKDIM
ncbi:MAG: helix-turn-helix transcriptional regulator [Lachnospiraceae bacterium]|nr:helix-turn-helix transcriptional regulator [Lachnospiraceae bacterium]